MINGVNRSCFSTLNMNVRVCNDLNNDHLGRSSVGTGLKS